MAEIIKREPRAMTSFGLYLCYSMAPTGFILHCITKLHGKIRVASFKLAFSSPKKW
jgi:hypothetical protein